MIAKQVRIEIQRLIGGLVADGVFGNKTDAQLARLAKTPDGEEWLPIAPVAPVTTEPDLSENVSSHVDERSEKNIATLHPQLQPLARALVNTAVDRGISIRITSGTRTYAEQDALFAKGGVTKARGGQSNHNFGLAFDVTLFAGSDPVWESPKYKTVGAIGKSLGLEWGGDWESFKDEPHFEMVPAWARSLSSSQRLAQYRKRHDAGADMVA